MILPLRLCAFAWKNSFGLRLCCAVFLLIVTDGLLPLADGSRQRWSTLAQSPTATLSGTVIDDAGAGIPSVNLTLLNLSTALQRHATTDEEGGYLVPLLPLGRYHITAQRDGFTTVVIKNIVLNTGDQLVLRIKLKVGEIGAFVTIVDNVVGSQHSAAVGTVIDRDLFAYLPLNGRSFQSLFELTPGVVLTRTNFNEQGQFSVNGQRANANYFMVDGVSANFGVSAGAAPGQAAAGTLPALSALGSTHNLVSLEALQEFRILTSTYAPEFGRMPGAQISVTTRPGSNEFRGSVFEYFRHEAMDANDWFANSRGLPRPASRLNDFGGVLGGPVIRNNTFFFFSTEMVRLRQPQVAVTEVPSLRARQNATAAIKPFLNAFPVPNGPERDSGVAEFAASYSDPARLNATSLRIDVVTSERLALFGRFNYATSNTIQRGARILPGLSVQPVVNLNVTQSLNVLSRADVNTVTVTGGGTFSFGRHGINELRANWSRASGNTSFTLDDFGGARALPVSHIFPPATASEDAGFQFLSGTTTNLSLGRNVDNLQRQVNLIDSLSVVHGSHQLKFGVDYRRLTPIYNALRYSQSVVFGSITEALSGIANSVEVFTGTGPRFPVFTNFSAYAQDTWRATRRLSLIWGLRWELNPPPTEARGNDPFTVQGLHDPDNITLAPRGTDLWQTTYDNFAPRLGVAYQLSSTPGREMVVRTGLGLFFDLGNGQAAQGFGNVFPYIAVKRFTSVAFPLDSEKAAPPPINLAPPFGPIVAFDSNLKLPLTYQCNVGIEKSLDLNHTMALTYIGAFGRRLLREGALSASSATNPDFAHTVRVTLNAAKSDYHAMQFQAERRLSKGLQALVYYTWSHSIAHASGDSLSSRPGSVPEAPFIKLSPPPSDFDIRHSFTLAVSYTLPAERLTSRASVILRNWSIGAVLHARTATPVNIVLRSTFTDEAALIARLQRPNLISGVPLYIDDPAVAGGRRINRAAFATSNLDRPQGPLGYNALRGFGVSQFDLALRRQFNLNQRLNLQFKVEFFNLFNHPNFGDPVNVLSSNLFGQSTQMFGRSLGSGGINGGLIPLYQIGGPRSTQLALKIQF